jgi:aminoglycoside phosphotransferase
MARAAWVTTMATDIQYVSGTEVDMTFEFFVLDTVNGNNIYSANARVDLAGNAQSVEVAIRDAILAHNGAIASGIQASECYQCAIRRG